MDQAISQVWEQLCDYQVQHMYFPKDGLWRLLEPLLRSAYLSSRTSTPAQGHRLSTQPAPRSTPPPLSRPMSQSPQASRAPLQTPRMGTPSRIISQSVPAPRRNTPPPFSTRRRASEEKRDTPWWKGSSVVNSLRLRINRNPELRPVFEALCDPGYARCFEQQLDEVGLCMTMEKGQSRLLRWMLQEQKLNNRPGSAMILWDILQPLLMREARATEQHYEPHSDGIHTPLPSSLLPAHMLPAEDESLPQS
ncbi:MAG: hypothetical protein EP343_27340 [Deltaproteobacteria bacterium]|nr:MAG: hypothetical protein EP343_27340 [Deltaproteobacteria bacterium]